MSEQQPGPVIAIRGYLPEDRNFILATWLRGLYYGNTWFSDIKKDIFMTRYHQVLEHILSHPCTTIRVACLEDEPSVILGYSVYRVLDDITVLDWIFVKSAWRKAGIGRRLVPKNVSSCSHLTKVGRALKPSTWDFNPFSIS